jgi:mRNA interferase MazF
VWRVDFDPSTGQEQRKTRPAVVMKVANVGLLHLQIVVPITDWKPYFAKYPWFVHLLPDAINGLTKESGADAFQVRSLSEARFINKLGTLPPLQMQAIAAAIALCVGYTPPTVN